MRVVYRGHDDVMTTDYNGRRYGFRKNIPVEISPEVYNNIIRSRNVEAEYLQVCEEPVAKENDENIPDTPEVKSEPKKKEVVKNKKGAVK